MTQERIIRPAKNVYGSLRLPGDKSISHRYGMLAAFAEGTSRFTNFSSGADCASTLACMQALGAKVCRGDLTDPAAWVPATRTAEAVVHIALAGADLEHEIKGKVAPLASHSCCL